MVLSTCDFVWTVQEAGECAAGIFGISVFPDVLLESALNIQRRAEPFPTGVTHNIGGIEAWGGYQGIMIDPNSGVLIGGFGSRQRRSPLWGGNSGYIKSHQYSSVVRRFK